MAAMLGSSSLNIKAPDTLLCFLIPRLEHKYVQNTNQPIVINHIRLYSLQIYIYIYMYA